MSAAPSRRSGYDDDVARARHIGAAVAVALALGGACRGPGVISIGTTIVAPGATIYLSPMGSDDNNCATPDQACQTFRKALPMLQPGSTLILEDGTYTAATTGYLNIRCDGATVDAGAPPSSTDAVFVANGVVGMPIIVQAEHPRLAFLSGDGSGPPLTVDGGCQYWTFDGLRVESTDVDKPLDSPLDNGSVIVVGFDNTGLVFENLLARYPNRYLHSHVLRIGDGSNDVTVRDSEFYNFHHNAIEAWRTDHLMLLRNYINSHDTPDTGAPGAYVSEAGTIGDYGIFLEETSHTIAANNIIEDVNDGIGIVGRYGSVQPSSKLISDRIEGNAFLGNIILHPLDFGFRIDSRCVMPSMTAPPSMTPQVPCNDDARKVTSTDLENDVVIGGAAGISSAGAVGTTINELTVIGAANGVLIYKESQNAGVTSTSTTTNALVTGFQAEAFEVFQEEQWSFDHCATDATGAHAMNNFVVLQPSGAGTVTNQVTFMSDLQGCLFYIPATSSLKGAGGGGRDVGANVVLAYQNDGVSLTQTPLWSAAGFTKCGAVVPGKDAQGKDINSTLACTDVATRLNLAPTGTCPLPP
jgi:hypothetical protein